MPDPFDILRLLFESLYAIYVDPSLLLALARSMAITFAFAMPVLGTSWGLRRYAKRHGREIPRGAMPVENRVEPFVDARLNEPYALIQRYKFLVLGVVLIAAIALGISVSSIWVFSAFCVLGSFIAGANALYIEACLAFGAEAAPAADTAPVSTPAIN